MTGRGDVPRTVLTRGRSAPPGSQGTFLPDLGEYRPHLPWRVLQSADKHELLLRRRCGKITTVDCIGACMRRRSSILAIAILVAGIAPAQAIDVQNLFGHTVRVEGEYPERALKIDGRELHRNAILLFDGLIIVSGVPALIGSSSNGGNACDSSPFVVSFPPEGKPRFDGPIEACRVFRRQDCVLD